MTNPWNENGPIRLAQLTLKMGQVTMKIRECLKVSMLQNDDFGKGNNLVSLEQELELKLHRRMEG